MKTKFYFETKDSEMYYNDEYYQWYMKENKLNEIEVYKAEPEKIGGIFWCKEYQFCGDSDEKTCGLGCIEYSPRNGKSGCCKHYTTQLYTHSDKITLQLTLK